jgi:hypothetical protein
MTDKLVRFFYKRLYWLVPLWYGLTQWLTGWRRWPDLDHYYTTREIVEALKWGQHWRPDPIKGVLDVLMCPGKFQAKINAGDTEFGDCDDHALYWCTALLQSGLASAAWLGTVWYGREGQKSKGHVVCIFAVEGLHFWCDYRDPSPSLTRWEWATDVAVARDKDAIAAGVTEVVLRRNGAPKFRVRTAKAHLF